MQVERQGLLHLISQRHSVRFGMPDCSTCNPKYLGSIFWRNVHDVLDGQSSPLISPMLKFLRDQFFEGTFMMFLMASLHLLYHQCWSSSGINFLKERSWCSWWPVFTSYITNVEVPQGSILGQILFLVFINDLPYEVLWRIGIFADDTTLYSSCGTELDLRSIVEYGETDGL